MTPRKIDYSKYSKEELIDEITELKKRKKYGLVWDEEREPEKVVINCKKQFPILIENDEKNIYNDIKSITHTMIEGDNYHALSILNYTHHNSIDIIYIDPPYNTGKPKEWKYNDRFVDLNDMYRHSKWLSFMSKRLQIARNLLSEEGVIFISIDDNEYSQLKMVCDQIFLEKNFVGSLVWEKKKKGSHLDKNITNIKEYILVYRKSQKFRGLIGIITDEKETYPCLNPGNGYSIRIIPKGTSSNYRSSSYELKKGEIISAGTMKLKLHSDLIIEDNKLTKNVEIEAEWRYSQNKIDKYANDGSLYFTRDLYLRRVVTDIREKKLKDLLPRVEDNYLSDLRIDLIDEYAKESPEDTLVHSLRSEIDKYLNNTIDIKNLFLDGWGSNEDADNEQRDFFGKKVFDYPKPSKLIKKLLISTRLKKATVLDFFAGTGTTAQAVCELNDSGFEYNFIVNTNNEDNNNDGIKIAEDICYPRIKKVIMGYTKRDGTKVNGTGGNLKYFQTSFVPAKSTDHNKEVLTKHSVEMLCLKEDTFESVLDTEPLKIYKGNKRYTCILFDELKIPELKKQIIDFKLPCSVYIFSLGDDDFIEEFAELGDKVKICSIPVAILRVYKRIFK